MRKIDYADLERRLITGVDKEYSPLKILGNIHPFFDLRFVFKDELIAFNEDLKDIKEEILKCINEPDYLEKLVKEKSERRHASAVEIARGNLDKGEKVNLIRDILHCGSAVAVDLIEKEMGK